jgi:ribonuclease R
MRKPLPSRTAVLDLLKSQDRALDAQEVGEKLGVAATSHAGLLRVLDDLVFDGVVIARGDKFKVGPAEKTPESSSFGGRGTAPSSARSPSSAGKKKTLKGLPQDLGGGPRGRTSPTRKRDRSPSPEKKGARTAPVFHDRAPKHQAQREGILKVNPRGFGFVSSPTATGDDVYISPENLGGAMHGDHVNVEIIGRGGRGAEGSIVNVKARGSQRVSGILRRRGKSAWVELDDPRIKGPVVLTSEIDKTSSEGEGNSGKDGQVVVVQITRFPETGDENPEGKLLAVLGAPGELSVETQKIILVHGISEVHSAQAIEEAEAYGDTVPEEMLAGREDLTHIPLPTIDPEDARDHDDAVWVERTSDGGFEVWVAIADVSSYVRPGTFIDEESRARGCSIYLPDRAIPMLPRALSSNLCSLLPNVTRLCLCVHAVLDSRGTIKKSRLIRGFMKSAAKLTYGGVARALGFTEIPPRDPKADAMLKGLEVAAECSRLLRAKRMKRGALDFDLPEAVVKLDEEGKPSSISKRSGDPGMKKAYQLIEELMIFANEAVARWLLEHELPGIYRVHLPPDPKKLDKLAAMCTMLGLEFDVDSTQTPKDLADLLKTFDNHPLSNVLNNLLLRSMKQATYDVQNLEHFGLASEAYLHFTSPIRRYPDLVVHRIVHAAVDGDERSRKKRVAAVGDMEKLTDAASQSSLAERRAMEVEREIVDIYRCFYMIDHIGERFEGTVSAFVGTGAFVTLDEPFVDVMVRVEDMGADYQIEDDGLMATSSRSGDAIRLGDRILVDVTDCAILRRLVYAKRVRNAEDARGDVLARRENAERAGPRGRGTSKGEPGPRGPLFGGGRGRVPKRGRASERGRGGADPRAGARPEIGKKGKKGKKGSTGGRKASKKGKRR